MRGSFVVAYLSEVGRQEQARAKFPAEAKI